MLCATFNGHLEVVRYLCTSCDADPKQPVVPHHTPQLLYADLCVRVISRQRQHLLVGVCSKLCVQRHLLPDLLVANSASHMRVICVCVCVCVCVSARAPAKSVSHTCYLCACVCMCVCVRARACQVCVSHASFVRICVCLTAGQQ